MDEQRAWLKARRKRRLRILAVMLSVCVLFTTYPDILATLSVFASEEQAQAEGRYISGFTALSKEIREQAVPVGTALSELSLPDTLEAVVTEQPSEDTVRQPGDDGKEEPEANEGKEPDGDTTGAEDKDGSTGETEEGGLSDSGQENTEEKNDTDAGEKTGGDQDTQPEKDGESEETDGKAAAGNEETADSEKGENTEESAPAEEQQESAVSQETYTVTMQEYHAENVIPVQTLENTQTQKKEETVTIDGVTWQSDPEYDGNAEGIYIFTAILPEGYALSEGVSLPEIAVTVQAGLTEKIKAVTAAGELLKKLLSDYFEGLSADEIYDAVLAMDEDVRLALTADYEELLAAMTDEDMEDGEMQSVTDEIRQGIADAPKPAPVKMPALFKTRAAAPKADTGIPMTRLSGGGTAFVCHHFVETLSFTPGAEYAFLNGIYGYEDAVASLGAGAILRVGAENNRSLHYIKEWYGESATVKTYVSVVKEGRDFDWCQKGGLYQAPNTSNPVEYRYFCYAGGAQNCGPYYAYTYETAALTYENVSASLKSIDRQGSSRSDDYTVTLNFNRQTLTLDEESYMVTVEDSDAVTIVVSDIDGKQITTNFKGPLAVHYEGNGNGSMGLPCAQRAESGKSVTLSSAVPTRSGYAFVNWKDKTTGLTYQSGQKISSFGTKSLYLLAQWKDVQKPDFTYQRTEALAGASKSDIEKAVKDTLTITDNEPVSECRVTVTMADDISKTVGDKTVTVTVTDKAGNQTTKTVPVTIMSLSLKLGAPVFAQNTKTLSAKLISPGGGDITEMGFVWGIMTSPTLTLNNGRQKTASPVTELNADISVTAAGIQKGVTYYARTYAIGDGVTYYSDETTFGLGLPAYGSFTIANNGNNTFTVTRTGGSEGAQTVYYRTVNGSAVGGTHFTHQAGMLDFAEGVTSKTITIAEQGANAAYSGKPATAYSNANRTYSVELYRVTGGSTLGSTTTAARTMTAGADYKVNRSLYTDEKSQVNVAETSTTNGWKIADTTKDQGGATDNVSFLTNRDNKQNYHTNSTFGTYYSNAREREYLEKTASGWYYRYDLLAYEYEDGYEHAYMGTKALEDKNYGLSSNSAAVSGVDGQLWACNFLQGQKEDAKHYYFPDTRTGGGESAGYPLDVSGSTTGYNGKTYVDLKLNETCYVYFGSTGANTDIWYVDGLTSYAIVHDEKEPQLVAVAPMAGGLYKAGDSFTVSLIFDEIVDSANSSLSNVRVKTNWGEASYAGGADTNVLYFTGTVKADANGSLSVTELTNPGNIKDMCSTAGTACTSKGGATTASVDASQPNLTAVSKGVSGGTGTVNVKVNADQAKTNALRYAWSDSASMPATGWVDATSAELASAKTTSGLSLSIRKEAGSGNSNGKWYLHVIGAYHTTGATTYKYAEVNFGTKSSPISPAPAVPTLMASADNSNWATSRSISVAATNAAGGTLQYRRAGTSPWTSLSLGSGGKVTKNVTENGYYTFRLTVGEYVLTKDVLVEKIDGQSPTAAVGTPAESGTNRTAKAGVYTKITLPITFSDSGSGVKTVQYEWTGTSSTPTSWQTLSLTDAQKQSGTAEIPYTASENGETNKYLHIKVTDNVGKTVTAVSAVYKMISQTAVDNHAPKITLTGAPTAWTNDTATLKWKLTDYSGKNYEVILPDGRKAKANAAQGEVWARQNGSYTVKVRDLDYGGENTATVDVTYIDTTAPSVTVSEVSGGWRTTAQSVTISASDSQSGVGKKYYKIVANDQETPGEGLTEFTTSSVSVGKNGVWYLYYKIYDQTGDDTVGREANKTEGFVGPIKIDAQTPTLTADAPDKGVSKTAGIEVALKAVYGASGGTVKVGNSIISALGATANDPGSSSDITKNATYKINAKGTYQFVLTGGSGKTARQSLTVYEASFDLQGGAGTAPAQLVVKNGLLTQPTAPTKAGSVFQGWYTAAGNEKWNFATGTVTSDCTLYARWKTDAYTVTFHENGGMIENESSFTSYTYGTALTLPTPTRTGYTFGGWYENENCIGTAVTEISAIDTGNKIFWAKWTPISYTISYNLDGGTVTGNPTEYTIESNAITLNNPTKEGYTFTGWSGTDLTDSNHMSVTIASGSTGHRTYTANWKLADYTVNLHTNGGTGGTDLTSYTFGTGAVLPTDWKKTGYVFDGWYENDSCTGTPVTNISGTDTGDKEYWAKWTDNIAPVIGTLTYNYQPKNFWHWLIGKDSLIITVPVTEEGSGADKIAYTVTPDGGTAKVETATIQNGEAKITVSADFRGTISIACTDKANNTSASVTVGAGVAPNGIIIEDNAPKIAFKAENAEILPSGEYKTVPQIVVTIADDKDNAISGGIASVSYQINGGSVKTVPHNYTASMVVSDSFTISADEITASGIPADGVVISVTATDNAGNISVPQTYTVKVHIHSGTLVPAVDPTCTTAGNKQHYTCTCGKLFSDSGCTNEITDQSTVVLDALGHYFEGQPYQVTTTQHWRKCSRCSVTEQKEDHTFGTDDKCTVCGYVGAVDPGHTHSGSLVAAKPATCTQDGHEAYYTCSCGKWFTDSACTSEITDHASVVVGKLGHNFVGEYLFDANGHWRLCSRCNAAQTPESHVFDNDNDATCNKCNYQRTVGTHTHSGTLVAATEPTCTTAGNKAYYRCSCGKWFSDSACTKEVTAQDVTIPAKGHTAVTDSAKAATCTETGLSEGSHCSVCGHVIKAQTVTAALGHDYSGNYHYDANGHWKVCSRCGTASAKQRHNYDNDRDTKCNDCGWVRTISDSDDEQDEQPTPTPTPEPPVPPQPTDTPTPQPPSQTDPPEQPQPTEKPDNPGTVPGTPDNSQPEDKQEPESTGTPEPTEKPSETEKEQQSEGDGEQTVPAAVDNGKIVMSGEPAATGNVDGMTDTKTVLKFGNGAVIVTVVCAEQEYTAGVADTLAVANAVLTPEQIQLVNNGETIEIRIDVKDISDQVPEQDKEVIENGIEEYRKGVPGLVLGMYVDISMFIRIGEGDWNAITEAEEPVEIIIGIPEKLQEKDRAYYIIRAHDGVPAFMNDMDDEPSTITVSTDLFSSYAIAYVQTEWIGHKCGLCHICPTFLRLCYFVWLAIIILIMIVVIILLRKKKEQETEDAGQ